VDDDRGVRESLAGVLTGEGFLVLPAANGIEALEIVDAIAIDLVILDLNMPAKNGWDTFERLSAEHPLLPVVIITARPNQLFTALGAGVGALLEKPLDIEHMLKTIDRLLAETNEARLRRLVGHRAPFDYKPSCGAAPGTLVGSAERKGEPHEEHPPEARPRTQERRL
jgi:DNA-binding response OmpR family regulator